MPNKKRTRREFLATSAGTVAVVTSIQPVRAAVFTADERSALAAAMDEIIPAAEGMPSATQAGGLDYLGRTIPSLPGLLDQFRQGLAGLDVQSRKSAGQPFAKLPRAGRVEVLSALERDNSAGFFALLRDFTYEAYYTRPEVWRQLGYESHLTDHPGPHMKPFDESVLSEVRKRGKLYREVS
ncbi:MAG: gluconate 2-dehydrogenase subunit 3 family protein [Acidobacteriia bacterium]|nr:gluconate 2-dehydrogenase subunit 3 family protein [Terriglobia bacterium]